MACTLARLAGAPGLLARVLAPGTRLVPPPRYGTLDGGPAAAPAAAAPSTSYGEALGAALRGAERLRATGVRPGDRVAVAAEPGPAYVAHTWAAWLAGAAVVPLAQAHPAAELAHVLSDSGAARVLLSTAEARRRVDAAAHLAGGAAWEVVETPPGRTGPEDHPALAEKLRHAGAALMRGGEEGRGNGALIVYTSGTTGRPKGALHTHGSLEAQIEALSSAWAWEAGDRILHPLPLHHVHGIVNALYCALHVGASVEFHTKFSSEEVWARLVSSEALTVFMGVPTMYHRLLEHYDALDTAGQREARRAAQRLRLTVSGSSACPTPIQERWKALSGHYLLERYGMTEIGMALSNPLAGERRPGSVGRPLPGVQVRLGGTGGGGGSSGELHVRGPAVFREYVGRPEKTAEAFDSEGWFLTGDTAAVDADGYYRILGRTSVDILKVDGYKVSALEIESQLLDHPRIRECAVVGLEEAHGQVVGLLAAFEGGPPPSLEEIRAWARERLAPYKLPRVLAVTDALPRNAMGKVNKKELVQAFDAV